MTPSGAAGGGEQEPPIGFAPNVAQRCRNSRLSGWALASGAEQRMIHLGVMLASTLQAARWTLSTSGHALIVGSVVVGMMGAIVYVGVGLAHGTLINVLTGLAFAIAYATVIVGLETLRRDVNLGLGILLFGSILVIASGWGLMSWTYLGAALSMSGPAVFVGTWLIAVSKVSLQSDRPEEDCDSF